MYWPREGPGLDGGGRGRAQVIWFSSWWEGFAPNAQWAEVGDDVFLDVSFAWFVIPLLPPSLNPLPLSCHVMLWEGTFS